MEWLVIVVLDGLEDIVKSPYVNPFANTEELATNPILAIVQELGTQDHSVKRRSATILVKTVDFATARTLVIAPTLGMQVKFAKLLCVNQIASLELAIDPTFAIALEPDSLVPLALNLLAKEAVSMEDLALDQINATVVELVGNQIAVKLQSVILDAKLEENAFHPTLAIATERDGRVMSVTFPSVMKDFAKTMEPVPDLISALVMVLDTSERLATSISMSAIKERNASMALNV